MKTIVCYGDSNTYGYNPKNELRYDLDIIWTSILANLLKDEYEVYNEGLNGRTTAYDRPNDPDKNGFTSLLPILHKYKQIDILVFMLGTNDCLKTTNLTVEQIASGMEKLLVTAKQDILSRQGYEPRIILVSPAAIGKEYKNSVFAYELDDETVNKSHQLAKPYKQLADKYNCDYLDCTDLDISTIDCEHLTEESHNKLAHMLYEIIR